MGNRRLAPGLRRMAVYLVLALGFAALEVEGARTDEEWSAMREAMIDAIAETARETSDYLGRDSLAPEVLKIMAAVPRHEFVPENELRHAYENRPLPIGHGQTISQPYIVALMTDLLQLTPTARVLEIGTGSGYQAAVLAGLVAEVYSVEIIPALARSAQARLERLGYAHVRTREGDGYYGWPEAAPFDAIIVTAAADQLPPPLVDQLKPGGRIVIPVGDRYTVQHLVVVHKDAAGAVTARAVLPVQFVPLTRGRD